LYELFEQAFSSDPVSAFGGIIITNREVDALTAQRLNEAFFEGILAPSFSPEALEILKTKKNRRLLTINFEKVDLLSQSKSTVFGTLHQSKYPELVKPSLWEHKAGPKLSNEDEAQLHKALLAVKHLKSNAIAVTKENKAIGLAAGHVSRVDACAHAISKAKSFDHSLEGAFMASDAFFPFRDCVDMAAESRVKAICQPGGSIRDDESIKACNELGVSLYFCGQRYFKH
jgi:phosphoribosylaminoimidazolecarboxamide formyltransferase/IMP cyclohydrolase